MGRGNAGAGGAAGAAAVTDSVPPPSTLPPFPEEEMGHVVAAALREDGAFEDVTSRTFVPTARMAHATLRVKRPGVVCGLPAVLAVLRAVSPRLAFTRLVPEGAEVAAGTEVAAVGGPARSLLAAERVALNLLGHMGGIATLTRAFVRAVEGTGVTVHPTRKTLPGLRAAAVYAVEVGGGHRHRSGLHEAILAKENHFRAAGVPFGEALRLARAAAPPGIPFGTEVETLGELCLALEAGADLILLDDFPVDQVRRAVEERNVRGKGPRPILEATGGITLESARAYAATGVERLSVGSLTHSAPWLDCSLKITEAHGGA